MTSHESTARGSEDELDLVVIIDNAIRFFRTYGKMILLAGVVGFVCAVAIFFSLPKRYSSRSILTSTVLTTDEEIEIIGNWSDLLKKNEVGILSDVFRCSPDAIRKLSSITAKGIESPDPNKQSRSFTIDIVVKNLDVVDSLQSGIIYALANNAYVKQRVNAKRESYQYLINETKSEISRLDSIKRTTEQSFNKRAGTGTSFMVDVSNIYGQAVALQEKLVQYEEDLRFVDAIQVLQEFKKYKEPIKTSKILPLCFGGLLLGLFAGLVFTLFNNLRNKLQSLKATTAA